MSATKKTALILCVDDYENILAGWKALLQSEGYDVLITSDWSRALQLIASHPVDEVVLDYYMPGFTGDVIASRMKTIKPNVPILLMSGDSSLSQDKRQSVDAFLLKADSIAVFLATVKTLLNTSRPALNTIVGSDQGEGTPSKHFDDLCSAKPAKAA